MSSIKKVNTSRKKATTNPSRASLIGTRSIRFNHQATLNDTLIDLANLNGYIPSMLNPVAADLTNVFAFKNNLVLSSETREYELVQGVDFNVIGTNLIFLNGFAALEDEKFHGKLVLPTSNVIASQTKTELNQYELPAGQTTLGIGTTFQVNQNAGQQIGSIKVFRDGKLQLRCVGNDINNDGNYIEVDSGNGQGSQIQFKSSSSVVDGVVVDFGIHNISDINVFSDIERLAGSILQLSQGMAQVTGNPASDYLTASVSEVDRNTLSTQVLDNLAEIETLKIKNKVQVKTLSNDISVDTADIADLRFNNLVVGKVYKVTMQISGVSGPQFVQMIAVHDGSIISRLAGQQEPSGTSDRFAAGTSVTFIATNTTVLFNYNSGGAGTSLEGNGTTFETFSMIEELNNYKIVDTF